MPKLFAVMLGGRAPGCQIELHDVVFVVGNTLEETYPRLVHKWFGSKERIHIDASVELTYVDQHKVTLSQQKAPKPQEKKLYFINFGAYKPGYFGEIHQVNFYVATTALEALERAKKELCASLLSQHCDDTFEVEAKLNDQGYVTDDIVEIVQVDRYFIQLSPESQNHHEMTVDARYRKITG